ncbi:hypothetical protein Tco_1506424 [Tanacetum coccineum]
MRVVVSELLDVVFVPGDPEITWQIVVRIIEVIVISSYDDDLSTDEEIVLMGDIPFSTTNDDDTHDAPAPVDQYVKKPIKSQVKVTNCVLALRVVNALDMDVGSLSTKRKSRIDLLTQQYEKFLISDEETIDSGFIQFNAIVTCLKLLDKDYSNKNHVRKFLRALSLRWRPKVTTIEEDKDLAELPLDELICNLKVYEMVLRNDGVISMSTTEKVKSLALKAKVNRGQTSNDSVCQDGSDEDEDEEEEFNLIVRNLWKLFKKGNRFRRENLFGNGGDRFDRGRGGRSKGVGSSRRERSCYGCSSKNHFVDDCPRAKVKKAFIGGFLSDSKGGDKIKKDATCLMAIGLQKDKYDALFTKCGALVPAVTQNHYDKHLSDGSSSIPNPRIQGHK